MYNKTKVSCLLRIKTNSQARIPASYLVRYLVRIPANYLLRIQANNLAWIQVSYLV